MSDWKVAINSNSAVWQGVVDYAAIRMAELTAICTALESTETQIRQAQSGMLELLRLISLPDLIRAEVQVSAARGKPNTGY